MVRIGDGEPFSEDDPNYDPDGDGVWTVVDTDFV